MFYTLDWIIIGLYCIGIIFFATYVSRKKAGYQRSAEDYLRLLQKIVYNLHP